MTTTRTKGPGPRARGRKKPTGNVISLSKTKRGAWGEELPDPRPAMLAYLAARGIDEACAERAELVALDATETAALAGEYNALGRCGFRIPFRDLDGCERPFLRVNFAGQVPVGFKADKHRKKAPKTWQPPATAPELYLPPVPPGLGRSWREIANDPNQDLVFTEGEVKAITAAHHGFTTVAALGVRNWHEGGDADRLVAGLRDFVWRGRQIFVAFDSDAATNPDVREAEERLKAALARRGANVAVIRLPAPTDGRKSQGIDDLIVAHGADALRRLLDGAERLPEALDEGGAIFDTEFPPVEFAIEPHLPRGELVEIHGAHGQFKSTIMLYAALSVATGEPWGGQVAKQGRSVFISLEDTAATLARRVRRWVEGGSKIDGARTARDRETLTRGIRARFKYLAREKAGPLVLTRTEYGQTLSRIATVERLASLCAGADLVVLETAARLHPGAETNEALAVFAGALERVATRTGACVVLVRHVSKERATTAQVDSYGGRGGGALADAARSVLSVVRDGDHPSDPVTLVHTKSTHTARGPDLAWRPESINGTVFLRAMTAEERACASAHQLLDRIRRAEGPGVTRRELERRLPKKGREERTKQLRAMLARLVEDGHLTETLPDGKRGPEAPVYRAVELRT